jgi:hypothetical protein
MILQKGSRVKAHRRSDEVRGQKREARSQNYRSPTFCNLHSEI